MYATMPEGRDIIDSQNVIKLLCFSHKVPSLGHGHVDFLLSYEIHKYEVIKIIKLNVRRFPLSAGWKF